MSPRRRIGSQIPTRRRGPSVLLYLTQVRPSGPRSGNSSPDFGDRCAGSWKFQGPFDSSTFSEPFNPSKKNDSSGFFRRFTDSSRPFIVPNKQTIHGIEEFYLEDGWFFVREANEQAFGGCLLGGGVHGGSPSGPERKTCHECVSGLYGEQ
jgi:hypothetical protein